MPDILEVRRTSPGFTCIGLPPWILGQKRVDRVVIEPTLKTSQRSKGGECGY